MHALDLDHGRWTEEDFLALQESTWPRIELLDGSLLVSAAPGGRHQRVCKALAVALDAPLPPDLEALEGVNVRVAPERILIPDIAITAFHEDLTVYRADQVLLVAEVSSPSSRVTDRITKPPVYAAAGIPWYLLIELDAPDAPEAWLGRLKGENYVEHARARGGETLTLTEPVVVTIKLDGLPRRR